MDHINIENGSRGAGKACIHNSVEIGAKDSSAEEIKRISNVADRMSWDGLVARSRELSMTEQIMSNPP
jgi:hypothetical protein